MVGHEILDLGMQVRVLPRQPKGEITMATILICDLCGSKQNVKRCSWTIDRKADATGSMDDIFVGVDLCLKCENRLLKRVVNDLIGERVKNKPEREIEFGKRIWAEYNEISGG